MIHTIFAVLFLLVSCKKSSNLSVIDSQKIRLAIVSLPRIEQNSVALKGIEKAFLKKEKIARSELLKKQNEISLKYKALESKKSILDKSSIEKKTAEIEQEMLNLQKEERDIARIFEFVKYQVSTEMQNEIKKSTKNFAEQNGYVMVLAENNLLYCDDSVSDITLEVLTKLNSSFKTIDVENYFSIAEKEVIKTRQ